MERKNMVLCILFVCAAMCVTIAADGAAKAAAKKPAKAPVKTTAKPVQYVRFKSDDGLFSVEAPKAFSNFQLQTHDVETSVGTKKMNIYMAAGKDLVYMVSVMPLDWPKGMDFDLKAGMEGGLKGLVGDGTLLHRDDITVEGSPAIQARFKKVDGNNVFFGESMQTVVEMIQFQLQVMASDKAQLDSPDVKHFLKSFKYMGPRGAKKVGNTQNAPEYTRFSSDDGFFSIELPAKYAKMEKEEKKLDTALGQRTMNIYMSGGDDLLFLVSTMNLELAEGTAFDEKAALKGGIEGMVGDGELLDQQETEVQGHAALAARFSKKNNGKTIYFQTIETIMDGTQVQLQAIAYNIDQLNSDAVKRFLASFNH
jgi:hypothetical protein